MGLLAYINPCPLGPEWAALTVLGFEAQGRFRRISNSPLRGSATTPSVCAVLLATKNI